MKRSTDKLFKGEENKRIKDESKKNSKKLSLELSILKCPFNYKVKNVEQKTVYTTPGDQERALTCSYI